MGIRRIEFVNSCNESLNSNSSVESVDLLNGDDQVPFLMQSKPKSFSESNQEGKGVTLSWHDLNVYVPVPGQGFFQRSSTNKPFKKVLNNVAGIVHPGTLMAVMGASGAGKTSLLQVLARRAPANIVVDGDIRINGLPIGNFVRKISGYVYQDDLFFDCLTVMEHLSFIARMKLDRRLTKWERQRRIEELLENLSLGKCQHTRIEKLSGGEKKRLSFASEIISEKYLVFADESTTGLDSFSAQRIIGFMKSLAAKGKTVLCTIHQPSSQVFAMFDQVCLLAEGKTAYIGSTTGAKQFLTNLGHICPEHYNPADFYIRTLAVFPGKEEESKKNIKDICDSFANSKHYAEMETDISEEISRYDFAYDSKSSDSISDQTLLGGHNNRKPLWLTQLYWLSWRALIESWRNPRVHMVRTVQKIVLGLLVGFCFFGVIMDQKGIQDIQGAIFVFITENTFPSMYGVLHVFPLELPLFLRENKNGLYRVDAYYLAKIMSLVPGFVVEPLIFTTIAYWMVGLRATFSAFCLTCIVVLLTANTAASCGCFFSAAFDNISTSIALLIPFDYLLFITGGIFINLGSISGFLSWTKFLSWFMYANEAINTIQWDGVTNITCNADPEAPCITSGDVVLDVRDFDKSNFLYDLGGMLCLYCTFHFFAFVALLLKSRRK